MSSSVKGGHQATWHWFLLNANILRFSISVFYLVPCLENPWRKRYEPHRTWKWLWKPNLENRSQKEKKKVYKISLFRKWDCPANYLALFVSPVTPDRLYSSPWQPSSLGCNKSCNLVQWPFLATESAKAGRNPSRVGGIWEKKPNFSCGCSILDSVCLYHSVYFCFCS